MSAMLTRPYFGMGVLHSPGSGKTLTSQGRRQQSAQTMAGGTAIVQGIVRVFDRLLLSLSAGGKPHAPQDTMLALSATCQISRDVVLSGWASAPQPAFVGKQPFRQHVDEWHVGLTNLANDKTGWGMTVGSPSTQVTDLVDTDGTALSHLQAEAFLQFTFRDNLTLSPGIVYLKRGDTESNQLILRTEWFS